MKKDLNNREDLVNKSEVQEEEGSLVQHASEGQLHSLRALLENRQTKLIRQQVSAMHPADLADVIESFPPHERTELVTILKPVLVPEFLTYLENPIRIQLAEALGVKYLATAFKNLDSDDAMLIMEALSPAHQRQLLEVIPKQTRVSVEQSLSFPEDSAGRIMQQEVVVAHPFWTVKETLKHIQSNKNLPSGFLDIFVINAHNELKGCIPVYQLVKATGATKASDLYNQDQQVIPVTTSKKEVAQFFHHYSYVSAPVVDDQGHLLGVITADDILDVLEEETEKEILNITGVSDTDFFSPMFETFYRRLGWLMISFLNALLSVFVVSQFTHSLEEMVALAVLMPMVGTMAGNAGTQVVTVTVRALSIKALRSLNTARTIGKETLIGALNGVLFGLLLVGLAVAYFDSIFLGAILASAMLFTMLWAAAAGVLMPLILERLKFDPAIASGPLITATCDVLGYVLFLGLATSFLLQS